MHHCRLGGLGFFSFLGSRSGRLATAHVRELERVLQGGCLWNGWLVKDEGRDERGEGKGSKQPRRSLTLYLLVMFSLLIFATYAVLSYAEKNILHEREHKFTHELGNNIVAEIGSRIAQTESLAKSIARLAEKLNKDPEVYMNTFPGIIDYQGMDTIAGGGIWPEPFKFSLDLERSSFFSLFRIKYRQ